MDMDEDQEFQELIETELLPKVRDSSFCVSLCPADPNDIDAKFSVELGLMIMLDKPIICCVQPGTKIPEKLARVVDRFVEIDPDNKKQGFQRLADVIKEIQAEIGDKNEKRK